MEHRTIDGLALSGGGFRAALFHIGVLARLAELDLLRQVKILSTVSGGTLVGVCYFLHVKELLEKSSNETITREDYIAIVSMMCREFLRDVQKDLRARAYGHFNVWRSSSETFGLLCEKHLYPRSILQTDGLAPKKQRPCMTDLKIKSQDGPNAKVPDLWINATSLSTGQQWVFTPAKMGTITLSESPSLWRKLYGDGDSTPSEFKALLMCLEGTVEYSKLPSALSTFPVGRAVAASACVPGIFPPITLGFRPFGIGTAMIHLVDGGVIDNLGLRPLALARCRSTLVSDASAPGSPDIQGVSKSALKGLWGSLGALLSFSQAASLQLWKEFPGRKESGGDSKDVLVSLPKFRGPIGGVHDSVVEAIRQIRTDLDVFTDLEGYALMYAGYQIASSELRQQGYQIANEPSGPDNAEPWPFLGVTEKLNKYSGKLRAARSRVKFMRILYSGVARVILAALLLPGLQVVAVRLFPEFAQEHKLVIVPVVIMVLALTAIFLVVLWKVMQVVGDCAIAATSWVTFLLGRILKWRDGLDEGRFA